MKPSNRRNFLQLGAVGLASGAASLVLPKGTQATEPSGTIDEYTRFIAKTDARPLTEIPAMKRPPMIATEDNILGPYYRKGAPFRGKVTPPREPGDVIVIQGRVWGIDSRAPLANARLDIWQANAAGRYDNDDAKNPPAANVFYNRCRLAVDETGYYEFETIRPGRYQIGTDRWRPSHIHYLIAAPGYKPLVTQLYFKGDPENGRDSFIKKSLIIEPTKIASAGGTYELGQFDIVLERA